MTNTNFRKTLDDKIFSFIPGGVFFAKSSFYRLGSKKLESLIKKADVLVPFYFIWENDRYKNEGREMLSKKFNRSWLLTMVYTTLVIAYAVLSLNYGTLDYRKWPEIKKIQHVKYLQEQDSIRKERELYLFRQLDKNHDGIVDEKDIEIPYVIKPLHRAPVPPFL